MRELRHGERVEAGVDRHPKHLVRLERGKGRWHVGIEHGEQAVGRELPEPCVGAVKHGGEVVGYVSSGTFGPSLGVGVGFAYLPEALTVPGTALTAGPKDMTIRVVPMPVYTQGTCRMQF